MAIQVNLIQADIYTPKPNDYLKEILSNGNVIFYQLEDDNTIVKAWQITYKAYGGVIRIEPVLKDKFSDLSYGWGRTYFNGTEKECSEYISEMRKELQGLNIVGIEEYKPKN